MTGARRAMPIRLIPLMLCLFLCAGRAQGWGETGHRAVARVAATLLSPQAAAAVTRLLEPETLSDAATWADEVRPLPPYQWSAPLHYVNLPPGAEHFDMARDCPDGKCVTGAIIEMAATLASTSATLEGRREALKFLVHFVGDLHQPLHAGHAADRGGNDIKIRFLDDSRETNLHRAWDSMIIGEYAKDWRRLGDDLSERLTPRRVAAWQEIDPAAWTMQSFRLAEARAYAIPADGRVTRGYVADNWFITREQLSCAGVRLAALLNRTYGGPTPLEILNEARAGR